MSAGRGVKVPFLDLQALNASLEPRLFSAMQRVLKSGQYIGGPEVLNFESEFAAYCGTEHCVGVSNGLDALRLILEALGIGEGDEVIVPSHTFIATWLAVSAVGATPVPVAPDQRTMNMNPALVESAITSKTRAVIPVHLYGLPAEMAAICKVADAHELVVIEDAAQAHGARYGDRRVGSLGRAAAFSFYPAKNLGALGDAGAVTTDDAELAQRIRMLANYGSSKKYEHELQGGNCRMDPLQAAVLSEKLNVLDEWNAQRQAVAGRYLDELQDLTELLLPSPCDASVWHLFVVRTESRDELARYLAAHGIQTQVHYPIAPARQSAYSKSGFEPCGVTDKICQTALSLPMGPHINDQNMSYLLDRLCTFQARQDG